MDMDEVKEYYESAVGELLAPEIHFTDTVLGLYDIEKAGGEYVCDRFVRNDEGYCFFFKVTGKNFFFRILVLHSDKSACSSKIVCGIRATIEIRNYHNSRPFPTWLECFGDSVSHKIESDSLLIQLTDRMSCSVDEIIELLTMSVRENKKGDLREYSLENMNTLILECYLPKDFPTEIEMEKWSILDLGKYAMGLEFRYVIE